MKTYTTFITAATHEDVRTYLQNARGPLTPGRAAPEGGTAHVRAEFYPVGVAGTQRSCVLRVAALPVMAPAKLHDHWRQLAAKDTRFCTGDTRPAPGELLWRVSLYYVAPGAAPAPEPTPCAELHMDFYRDPRPQLFEAVEAAVPGLTCFYKPQRATETADSYVGYWRQGEEEGSGPIVMVRLVYGERGEQPTWWVSHPRQPAAGAVQVRTGEELADELVTCLAAQQTQK